MVELFIVLSMREYGDAQNTGLKQDSDLTIDELFKVKSKLKTGRSPGPNGLRYEMLKWRRSRLDYHIFGVFICSTHIGTVGQRFPENG